MLPPEPMRTLTFPRSFSTVILAVSAAFRARATRPASGTSEPPEASCAKRWRGPSKAAMAAPPLEARKVRRVSALVYLVVMGFPCAPGCISDFE
jgi:hypothetical protein